MWKFDDVRSWDRDVFSECSWVIESHQSECRADMRLSASALPTFAAVQVTFCCNKIVYGNMLYFTSACRHNAAEFMADDLTWLDGTSDPRIAPVVDWDIASTY